jgi:hypothetical protein
VEGFRKRLRKFETPFDVVLFDCPPGIRLPMPLAMIAKAALAGVGMLLLARVQPGTSYAGTVLPGLLVLGAGLGRRQAPSCFAALAALAG